MKPVYKKVDSLPELIDAIRIRVDVFIIEQKCKPGWEPDSEDKVSDLYIAVVDNKVVATVRVRKSKDEEFKIERMAVKKDYRNKGIGKGLVHYIINETKKNNPQKIWMQAQVQSQKFYEKCGFIAISEKYNLYNILHVDMKYEVTNE
jgi:predicted GNAT family N-acyltransferase